MKKQILALSLALMSMGAFAQKIELKEAGKAIKKLNFSGAVTAITAAEALLSNMDAKNKAKFYFLKGQAFNGQKNYKVAASAFNTLLSLEKETGKSKYSSKVEPMMFALKNDLTTKAFASYKNKDLKVAYEEFYLRYTLDKKDTLYLSNAAQISYQAKDFDTALKHYETLKEIGYTGISTEYYATNKETGVEENLGDKNKRNLFIKTGQYTNPEDRKTKSKKATVIKNLALILKEQGKVEEALLAMAEARKENPNDIDLLLANAFMYNDLKQMDKFGELISEAIKLDPKNPTLYFNLGVASADQKLDEEAIEYYKKAIELNPNYRDAYLNIAYTITNARLAVVEEMNQNLSNEKKYLALEKKNKAICNRALPFLEKADDMKRTVDTVRNLMNLYDTTEQFDKSDVLRPIYKTMIQQK